MWLHLSLCLELAMSSETRDGKTLCKDQGAMSSEGYSRQEGMLPMDKTRMTLGNSSVIGQGF